ncbi:uroporphyrinogen-III C-methyltransferase [Buchnera aphidicola (Rhopalosiphum padi)]|uniref:Siroheme synthase n=1 Tax=Buchnera aphidicola subsp. Rhopalosiphum padi TaxID=98793 RepID=A0A4D6Y9N7_BUCRP|nr:siroheme synthase CysG [Buchnera aphidicola]QCI25053.1 uroporphyrinogen-III C-methyltransferase [Buchnera aphidicola (Rhopalosiphum padi)]
MNYLPIFLDLKYKNVLVVGAGEVAFNKIKLLLRSGAIISIISKDISLEVKKLLDQKKVHWISEKFHFSHLNKTFLVIAATNNIKLNQKIFETCNNLSILVNVVDDQSKCSFIFPSIIDRSPIVIAISSGGTAPVLLRLLREKIEAILPVRLGDVAKIAGNWRSTIKQKFTTLLERRRFWEKLFNSIFVQYIINGEIKKAVKILIKMIDKPNLLIGEIILVGAGPGNSGLLTLRALQVLQEADVVLYDRLVSSEILEFVRRDAKCIYVGKSAGVKNITQDEIIKLLISLAKKGKKVVRLKGGDPFIFGRGGEELEAAKKEGIDVQVVPGITSAIGISAYTGIPLTHRDYAKGVIFITGHKCANDVSNNWSILSDSSYTLVVYMGTLQASYISQNLILYGRSKSTPIAVIGKGTTIKQKVIIGRLDELDKIVKFTINPSLLIIGEVVLLHKKLEWFNTSSSFNNIKNLSSIVNLI